MDVLKGDIVYMREDAYKPIVEEEGNIQAGERPLLVVSNDKGNHYSNICVVVPLTQKQKRLDLPFHVQLKHGKSIALCKQLFTINQSDITRITDHISEHEIRKIDFALCVSLGII